MNQIYWKDEHILKTKTIPGFFIRRKNSQRFNEILHYNKIYTKLYYSDRLFYWNIYYTSWSISWLATEKKNKAIKCKKLRFKKWIYIQINAKKKRDKKIKIIT